MFRFFLIITLWAAGLFLLSGNMVSAAEKAPPSFAFQVKAAFVRNFICLVQWPETAFAVPASPFVVCVLGDSPFTEHLVTFQAELVGTHPIQIRHCARIEEAADCHLLYVADTQKQPPATLLSALAGKPVLTVSDLPGFASLGGMIELFTLDQRIFFEVNRNALERTGLVGSSKLLRLSRSAQGHGGLHAQ